MAWSDIAMILFTCVTANHLGLVSAVESALRHRLQVINCPKCLTWWCCMGYCLCTTRNAIVSFAISFLAAYLAIWLELAMGFIDTLYNKAYEKIYSETADDTAAADADGGNSASTVPEL